MKTSLNKFIFLYSWSLWLISVKCAILPGSRTNGDYVGAFVVFNLTDPKTGQIEILGSEDPSVEIGKYGSTSPKINISGRVFHAEKQFKNNYGCWKPYRHVKASLPWIALVQRGNCTFAEKINQAYKANASGIVIYENENEVTLMSHEGAEDITSVMIPREIGREVAKRVDDGENVSVTIKRGLDHLTSMKDKTSIIFVSLSFLILMVISLTWLIVYYVQRFRIIQAPNLMRQRRCQAHKLVSKIQKKVLKHGDSEIKNEEVCSICIENYKADDMLRILPCKHFFHRKCVDPWLRVKETCPLCKFDVLKFMGLCPLPLDPGMLFGRTVTPVVEVWEQDENTNISSDHVSNSSDSLVGETHEETVLVNVEDTQSNPEPDQNTSESVSETTGTNPEQLQQVSVDDSTVSREPSCSANA